MLVDPVAASVTCAPDPVAGLFAVVVVARVVFTLAVAAVETLIVVECGVLDLAATVVACVVALPAAPTAAVERVLGAATQLEPNSESCELTG